MVCSSPRGLWVYSCSACFCRMAAMASLRERSMRLRSSILIILTGMTSPMETTSYTFSTRWSSSLLMWTRPSLPGAISTMAPMGSMRVTRP